MNRRKFLTLSLITATAMPLLAKGTNNNEVAAKPKVAENNEDFFPYDEIDSLLGELDLEDTRRTVKNINKDRKDTSWLAQEDIDSLLK